MTINVSLPDEFLEYFKGSLKELQKVNIVVLAIELYLADKVSIGRAAELSSLSFDEFHAELSRRKILRRGGPSSVEEMEEELTSAQEFFKQE